MWWKGLLLFHCFVQYECKWGRSELISLLSYQQDKGNTCFIRTLTKRKTSGIFRYISGICPSRLCFTLHHTARAARNFLSSSRKKVSSLEWISVEVLQSKTRVSMTLVFWGDRLRCYLCDHKAKSFSEGWKWITGPIPLHFWQSFVETRFIFSYWLTHSKTACLFLNTVHSEKDAIVSADTEKNSTDNRNLKKKHFC